MKCSAQWTTHTGIPEYVLEMQCRGPVQVIQNQKHWYFRVPWTARRSNQSILKEVSPVYSLEVLMLKLKLQYFGHLMLRADSLEKTLMLGKIEGGRRRRWGLGGWMASPTQWTWVSVNSGSWWWTERPGVLQSMGSERVRHDWATELSWTEVPHSYQGAAVKYKDQAVQGQTVVLMSISHFLMISVGHCVWMPLCAFCLSFP